MIFGKRVVCMNQLPCCIPQPHQGCVACILGLPGGHQGASMALSLQKFRAVLVIPQRTGAEAYCVLTLLVSSGFPVSCCIRARHTFSLFGASHLRKSNNPECREHVTELSDYTQGTHSSKRVQKSHGQMAKTLNKQI
jgi:hypothetical protein